MATITVSAQDVTDAGNFLEQFLTDAIDNGDFSNGTALRDLTVKALSYIFAYLRKEADTIRQGQSLNTVSESVGGDASALQDAVTAILSNVFVTPKQGSKSRGFAIGHASEQVDIFIPTNASFTRTQGTVFVVDSASTLFIPKSDLVPIIDASGVVTDYEFRIPLVAVKVGDAYDIAPGLFADFDRFSPYVTRIENTEAFAGGRGPETVDEILARAPTAVSVRNLINDRSITAVLLDTFAEIRSLFVAGMGDPEMQRDRIPGVAPHLILHVGGMTDIYLLLDLVETSFTGVVGDLYERPDGLAVMFRDPSANFAAVQPGDILHVTDGLPSVPAEFLIIANHGDTLEVSERSPFPVATDEANPPARVTYTIGRVGSVYNDVLADVGGVPLVTGLTSRRVATSGRVTLPGGPVMDILDVALVDPAPAESAFVDPLDGFVHFPNQVNGVPSQTASPSAGLQFVTNVNNPNYAQSALQWMEIVVGTDTNQARFDGKQLRVRYRTLSAFFDIDSFVRSRGERTTAASQLPRGHHPVSISLDVNYKLKPTATTTLDNAAISKTIVDYLNAFDTSQVPIDTSAIEALIRSTYPTIASIAPITINYVLRAPTGQLLSYQTLDEVLVEPSKLVAGPSIDLAGLGVTSKTLRYLAHVNDVRALQVF